MIDPREIEGSPERAADRGRAEDMGFDFSDKPSLGNPDVVRGLVSEFAARVVEVRKHYNEDKLTGQQAQESVRELAREYGRIVMGQNEAYSALPWDDPSRLGRRIKLVVPAVDGIDDPAELLFLTIGSSLSSLAAAHETGNLTDEQAQEHIQEMLEDTVNLILGLR